MAKIRSILRECRDACLAATGSCLASEVLNFALANYGPELREHQEEAMRREYLSMLKALLKETSEDDGVDSGASTQLPLPGFDPPTTMAVLQADGEYLYVLFLRMTWEQMQGAIEERDRNMDRVRKRRADLRRKARVLRPYMENNPSMTVQDALVLLQRDQAA